MTILPIGVSTVGRAVTPGKFTVPAVHAEAMYDPDMNGTFVPPAGQDVFEVK